MFTCTIVWESSAVEKKIKEAEEYAETDKKAKERAESANAAETLIYTTEKFMKENGEKVSAASKEEVEKAKASLKEVLEKQNYDDMQKKMDALSEAIQRAGAELYKQGSQENGTGPENPGGGEGGGDSGNAGSYDADYTVKK